MPNLSPKRSETMREFAGWVRADVSRKDEVASFPSLHGGTVSLPVVRHEPEGFGGYRSSGSPSSHVTPNAATTGCPSDISIGDAGDISIGDLQQDDAILALC